MINKFKSIVIGCGIIGSGNYKDYKNSHAYAYKKNKNINLVCGVDTNKKKLRQFSKIFKCNNSTNILNTLKFYKPDVISVCTPDSTHFKIVNKILDSKFKPLIIFLEKPCCNNLREFNYILKKSKKKRVQILVNHSRRFNTNFLKLKTKIKNGKFGKLKSSYSFYYNGWMHNGIHLVDDFIFFFGKDLVVDKVEKANLLDKQKNLTFDAILRFKNSNTKLSFIGVDYNNYQIFDTDLRFENSRVCIDNFGQNIYIQKKNFNKLGENVLTNKKLLFLRPKISNFENAISKIVKYLKKKEKLYLKNYRIDDFKKTMKIMWDAQKKYENKFKK